MIVREEEGSLLLITQPDHARLAGAIVAAVRTEPALESLSRRAVLLAAREHDNGWIEVDEEPAIDPASGRPYDFVSGPARVKHELWPRGVRRVTAMDPRAGALVAQHAVTVYGYRRDEAAWGGFFDTMTAMRDGLLRRIGAFEGAGRGRFDAEYRSVRLGDSLSLQFCNGWREPHDAAGYRAVMRGSTLVIAPDPFDGGAVSLQVVGRRIPARPYRNDADLRGALAAATPEGIIGQAVGAASVP